MLASVKTQQAHHAPVEVEYVPTMQEVHTEATEEPAKQVQHQGTAHDECESKPSRDKQCYLHKDPNGESSLLAANYRRFLALGWHTLTTTLD